MATDNKRPKIAILGSLNYDLVTTTSRVPSAGETLTALSFSTHPGGKGANQAVACARATRSKPEPTATPSSPREHGVDVDVDVDVDVCMYGGVGPDDYGEKLRSTLVENGIDAAHVLTAPGVSTGIATVLVEESGENRILVVPGANGWLESTTVVDDVFNDDDEPDLLIMQGEIPLGMIHAAILRARTAGRDVLWNPAPVPPLREYYQLGMDGVFEGLAHLIVNEDEAGTLARRIAGMEEQGEGEMEMDGERLNSAFEAFKRAGVRNVVVTLGGRGAAWRGEDGNVRRVSAVKGVKTVDTTAAGDTFVGYYAAGVVEAKMSGEEPDLEKIIGRANRAAAVSVTREGAISSIPWRDEVEESHS